MSDKSSILGLIYRDRLVRTEGPMPTVAEMTTNELREMIEAIIEKKLVELLGDPDEDYLLGKHSGRGS